MSEEPDDDSAAWEILKTNFRDDRGNIVPKVKGYHPTSSEWMAIGYLVGDWDYSYGAD